MREISRYDEMDAWESERERIGYISIPELGMLDLGICDMTLYRRQDGGYSLFMELEDESWFVGDFASVKD